jgi:serine phosphatase RsbU (regulator of sigma subunit)
VGKTFIIFLLFAVKLFAVENPCKDLFNNDYLNLKEAEQALQNKENDVESALAKVQEIKDRIELVANEGLKIELQASERLVLKAKEELELARKPLLPYIKKQEQNLNLSAHTRDIDLITFGLGAESDTRLVGYQSTHGGGKTSGDIISAVKNHDETISYFIGDVQGHSIYSSQVSSIIAKEMGSPKFKAMLTIDGDDITAAHQYLNSKHKEFFPHTSYESNYTLGQLKFNPKTGKVNISSTGEIYIFIIKNDGSVELLPAGAGKVGIGVGGWKTNEVQLRLEETMLSTTDGILESLSLYPKLAKKYNHVFDGYPDPEYGKFVLKELLQAIFIKNHNAIPAPIKINDEIRKFIKENKLPQRDDETLLTFKRK